MKHNDSLSSIHLHNLHSVQELKQQFSQKLNTQFYLYIIVPSVWGITPPHQQIPPSPEFWIAISNNFFIICTKDIYSLFVQNCVCLHCTAYIYYMLLLEGKSEQKINNCHNSFLSPMHIAGHFDRFVPVFIDKYSFLIIMHLSRNVCRWMLLFILHQRAV